MKWPVVDFKNKVVGEIDLRDDIFGVDIRPDILHSMVRWQQAKARQGTHQAKGVSDVSGSTRKPFKQKGTGRARQGRIRAPHMRGGGVVFGPVTRSHAFDLPKKVRKLALKTALAAKAAEGNLIIVDSLVMTQAKTKDVAQSLNNNAWNSILFIDGQAVNEFFARTVRNLPNTDLLPQQGANVHSILKRKTLVLSKDAVLHLEARLS
jgi:large subunit ribosomal protein L4